MKWDWWFKRRRWESRMDSEMRFHLEGLVEDYVRQGLSRKEAESRARTEFGSVDLAKDECRDQRPVEWLDHLARDLRFAWRSLYKSPGFAAAAIITLALGIGANTAIFSTVYAVLLKSLPYRQPDQLYSVEIVIPERRAQIPSVPATVQAFLEWRKSHTAFEEIAALTPWECNLTGDGEPERLSGAKVSANFFSVLGVPVARGRSFAPEEEQPGKERVVVISDALWRTRYAANPGVIGRQISINGQAYIVIGIASPSLLVPAGTSLHPLLPFGPKIDVWKPIAPTPRELAGESWDHGILGRLRPGESPEHGRHQLQSILNAWIRAKYPEVKTEFIPQLVPIREIYAGKIRLRLILIFAASSLLLLTACVNLANLFLARLASRAGEFAMRIALGAGRIRILSNTLCETMLLALAGGVLGAILAGYGTAFLTKHGPEDLRTLTVPPLNLPALFFALSLSVATGIVCGLVPAWRAFRNDLSVELQESGRTALSGGRAVGLRQLLVGVEMTLGTMLLASAGLLLHSFIKIMNVDRGYQVERVIAVDLSLFGERYSSGESRSGFYRNLTEHVGAIPGVAAAGAISNLPAVSASTGASRTIFYQTDTEFQRLVLARPVAMIRSITPGYFAASGTPLIAGRYLQAQEQSLVAVISQSLAKRLWPNESPAVAVGRTIRQGDVRGLLVTIVGVVQDARPGAVDREPPPVIYRPHSQWESGPMTLVVRTSRDAATLMASVRGEIRKMDPELPIPAIRTMREIVSTTVAQRRFQMVLTALFAVVAILLGAVGLYGVVSYAVTCRTRDIGVRIALGASRSAVMRWVFSSGMVPVLAGLAAGLVLAVIVARLARSLLFGVVPADPLSLTAVATILLVTSALACYLPARRAAALDPMAALRHD